MLASAAPALRDVRASGKPAADASFGRGAEVCAESSLALAKRVNATAGPRSIGETTSLDNPRVVARDESGPVSVSLPPPETLARTH
jgi:hypothetical protein